MSTLARPCRISASAACRRCRLHRLLWLLFVGSLALCENGYVPQKAILHFFPDVDYGKYMMRELARLNADRAAY